MCRDGTKGAASETSAVEAYGEFNHFVCRYALAFVLGVWQTGVGEVERVVELVLCKWLVGRVDYGKPSVYLLDDALGCIFVGLFLYMSEVFCLRFLVAQTFFVAVEDKVVGSYAARYLLFI